MENQQFPLPHLNDLPGLSAAEWSAASATLTPLLFASAGAGHLLPLC